MSFSRPRALIDSVNGRRAGGYRRHPEVSNKPDPADYASLAAFQWAAANWEDDHERETVESPWYAFATHASESEDYDKFAYSVAELQRIRSERTYSEIPQYSEEPPPVRAHLRMIIDEFIFEYEGTAEQSKVSLVIM